MNEERRYLSPVEKELLFDKWAKTQNVKMFLFDLDDTLCPTAWIFRQQMSVASEYLTQKLGLSSGSELRKEMQELNDGLFNINGVNPKRWDKFIITLTGRYQIPKDSQNELTKMFGQIYTTPLEIYPDAEKTLFFLQKVGMPIGIVTHANKDWTWEKYNWLGLSRFVDYSDVFVVNENGHKTADAWRQALGYFKTDPKNVAIVGDSPRSDINPGKEIGVKHLFLSRKGDIWSLHDQPVGANTIVIQDLTEIMEVGRSVL